METCDQLPNGVVDFQGERGIKNNAQRQGKSDPLLEKLPLKSLEIIKKIVIEQLDNKNQLYK